MKLFSWLFGFNRNHNSRKARIYKEVDEEKGINNNRRQKRTNWLANKFNIYGGSRLPEDPNELIKQGWKDITSYNEKKNTTNKKYFNKYTTQKVEFHKAKPGCKDGFRSKNHYHWVNTKSKNGKLDAKFDKYGNTCINHSKVSHIMPKKKGNKK